MFIFLENQEKSVWVVEVSQLTLSNGGMGTGFLVFLPPLNGGNYIIFVFICLLHCEEEEFIVFHFRMKQMIPKYQYSNDTISFVRLNAMLQVIRQKLSLSSSCYKLFFGTYSRLLWFTFILIHCFQDCSIKCECVFGRSCVWLQHHSIFEVFRLSFWDMWVTEFSLFSFLWGHYFVTLPFPLSSYLGMFSCACGTQVNITTNTTLNCPAPFESGEDSSNVVIGSVWMCPGKDFEVTLKRFWIFHFLWYFFAFVIFEGLWVESMLSVNLFCFIELDPHSNCLYWILVWQEAVFSGKLIIDGSEILGEFCKYSQITFASAQVFVGNHPKYEIKIVFAFLIVSFLLFSAYHWRFWVTQIRLINILFGIQMVSLYYLRNLGICLTFLCFVISKVRVWVRWLEMAFLLSMPISPI